MDQEQKPHPIVHQRNALALRNLDLELEIVLRDQKIAELEARVKELTDDTEEREAYIAELETQAMASADADQPAGD